MKYLKETKLPRGASDWSLIDCLAVPNGKNTSFAGLAIDIMLGFIV
jgi:hypothetical protein